MIIRLYILLGIVLLGGTGWFIVGEQPPTVQEVPVVAEVTRLQDAGVIPKGEIEENPEIEHGVFETPPDDEVHLEEARADMGSMAGMDMGGDRKVLDMDMDGDGVMDMSSTDMKPSGGMDMGGDGGSDMAMAPDGEMDEEEAAKAMAQQMAGLLISEDGDYDREISLSMSEWTFAPLNIEVQQGERIRFTVRNDGTLLHEFMFMTMAEMQAIDYRAKRADWSLFEHEALFEKSLLLPGQEITFVATITKPGAWMFMCMLPYHMQMGMMGQMATPGAAMKM